MIGACQGPRVEGELDAGTAAGTPPGAAPGSSSGGTASSNGGSGGAAERAGAGAETAGATGSGTASAGGDTSAAGSGGGAGGEGGSTSASAGSAGNGGGSSGGNGSGGNGSGGNGGGGGTATVGSCTPWFDAAPVVVRSEEGGWPRKQWATSDNYYWIENPSIQTSATALFRIATGAEAPYEYPDLRPFTTGSWRMALSDDVVLSWPSTTSDVLAFDPMGNELDSIPHTNDTGALAADGATGYYLDRAGEGADVLTQWIPGSTPTAVAALTDYGIDVEAGTELLISGTLIVVASLGDVWIGNLDGSDGEQRMDTTEIVTELQLSEAGVLAVTDYEGDFWMPLDGNSIVQLDDAIMALDAPPDCDVDDAWPDGFGSALFGDRYVYPARGGLFAVRLTATGVEAPQLLSRDVDLAYPRVTGTGSVYAHREETSVNVETLRLGRLEP